MLLNLFRIEYVHDSRKSHEENRMCSLVVHYWYKSNSNICKGWSWSWSYGSWIYNYLCNQCLSLLTLWVRTLFMTKCTRYNILEVNHCDRKYYIFKFPPNCTHIIVLRFGLDFVWFIVFNAIFNNIFQVYCGGHSENGDR
jgi:hypothetical protein